jgi:hypothetical protein
MLLQLITRLVILITKEFDVNEKQYKRQVATIAPEIYVHVGSKEPEPTSGDGGTLCHFNTFSFLKKKEKIR